MFGDHRRFAVYAQAAAREEKTYDEALDALDDARASEAERRERVKDYLAAGHELLTTMRGEIQ